LNVFNFFFITTAPILFKFDMMHLREKWDINCEFQVSCPLGPLGWEKSVKIDQFKKNLL
jgi:hypothetical protein